MIKKEPGNEVTFMQHTLECSVILQQMTQIWVETVQGMKTIKSTRKAPY